MVLGAVPDQSKKVKNFVRAVIIMKVIIPSQRTLINQTDLYSGLLNIVPF